MLSQVTIDALTLLFEALLSKDESQTHNCIDYIASIIVTEQQVNEVIKATAIMIYHLHRIEKAWHEMDAYLDSSPVK